MWLSPWVVMCLCRWSVSTVANGESADDTAGRLGGCRLVRGGVPVCHGRIVLCFPYLFKSFCTRILFKFGIRILVVSGCSSLSRV